MTVPDFVIDDNWEKVPEWCVPNAWVEMKEEFKASKGIYDPFQIDEQNPIQFNNDGRWLVRSLNDGYGIFFDVSHLQSAEAPEGSLEWMANEIERLKQENERLAKANQELSQSASDEAESQRLHNEAMAIAEMCEAEKRGELMFNADRIPKFKEAYRLEMQAIEATKSASSLDAWRSVLYSSAANLAYQGRLLKEAKQCCYKALAGTLPKDIHDQLEKLLQTMNTPQTGDYWRDR